MIALATLSRWSAIDKELSTIPIGDLELHDYKKYNGWNIVFLPSILLCEIIHIIIRIINFIINH